MSIDDVAIKEVKDTDGVQKKAAVVLMGIGAVGGIAQGANTYRVYKMIKETKNEEYGGKLAPHCVATGAFFLPLLAGAYLWARASRWYARMINDEDCG